MLSDIVQSKKQNMPKSKCGHGIKIFTFLYTLSSLTSSFSPVSVQQSSGGRAQFSTFLCMLRMHSTQPRIASLDSWDRTRSQTWRSAVPRWAAPVERLLLRNRATEPARLLLRSLIIRDRSKMKTAGMLPDCAAQKRKKALKRRGKGVVWLREGMKSPAILALSPSLSLLSFSLSGATEKIGGCKTWL